MVVVIDYGMGNLRSVSKALESIGADVRVSQNPADVRAADRIILPGVGAFGDGIRNLRVFGLADLLTEEVMEKRKPFLGICIGLQLLAEEGYERGRHEGLGWIPGSVVPIEVNDPALKIPHVGWNDITIRNSNPLLEPLRSKNNFYFVHSYYLACKDKNTVAATFDYGGTFTAAILHKNILATQFHPEKSQENGLRLLKSFLKWKPF